MSCACYSKVADPLVTHCLCTPTCHRKPVMQPSVCYHQLPSHHCQEELQHHHSCPQNNYNSLSNCHVPNIASPLHISRTPPQSHLHHCHTPHHPHTAMDVYHTPQQYHHGRRAQAQMFLSPRGYAQPSLFHSRRELIPTRQHSDARCVTPPNVHTHPSGSNLVVSNEPLSSYARSLPLSPNLHTPPRSSLMHQPVTQLDFSPEVEPLRPPSRVGFQLGCEYDTSKNKTVSRDRDMFCNDNVHVGDSMKEETETILVSEPSKPPNLSPGKQSHLEERSRRKQRKSSVKKFVSSEPPIEVIDVDAQTSNTDDPPPRYSLRGLTTSTSSSRNKTSVLSDHQSQSESNDMETVVEKRSVTKASHKRSSSLTVCKSMHPQIKLYPLRNRTKTSNSGQDKRVDKIAPKERSSYSLRRGKHYNWLDSGSSDSDCVVPAEESNCGSQATGEKPKRFTESSTASFLSDMPESAEQAENEPVDDATESQNGDGTSFEIDLQSEVSIHVPEEESERECIEETEVLSNRKDVDSVKVEGNNTTCQSPSKIVLVNWYFKVQANDSVTLFGFKDQDSTGKRWRSGAITECLSPRVLVTKRGTTYQLKGPMDRQGMEMEEKECPALTSKTLRQFRSGFPKAWRKILGCDQPNSKPQLMGDITTSTAQPEIPFTPIEAIKEEEKPKVKVELTPFHTSAVAQHDTSASSGFLSTLKYSSRGRALKPSTTSLSPYIQTSGEIYSYDIYGNFRGLTSPLIDLTLSDVEDTAPKNPRKRGVTRRMTVKKEELKKEEECLLDDSESLGGIKPKSPPDVHVPRYQTRNKVRKGKEELETKTASEDESYSGHQNTEIHESEPPASHSAPIRRKPHKRNKSSSSKTNAKPDVPKDTHFQAVGSKKDTSAAKRKGSADNLDHIPEPQGSANDLDHTPVTANSFVGNKSTGRSKTRQKRRRSRIIPTSLKKRNVTINEHLNENRTIKNDPKVTHKTKTEEAREKKGEKITDQQDEKARVKKGERKTDQQDEKARVKKGERITDQQDEEVARVKKGERITEQQDEEVDNEWTAEKIGILKRMVREVPALTPNFWAVVASRLSAGHSARECNAKYMEVCSKPSSQKHTKAKKAKKTSEADKKNYTITGKAGTLKRKRQLRTAMEHMDKGYTDDIFESTPFKKKVKTIVKLPYFSDSDGEESHSEEDVSDEPYTPNNARKRLGAPKIHTPKLCDMITTPDFKGGLKRDTADNVIFKIQRAKKPKNVQSKKPKSVPPPKRPRPPKTKPIISEQKLRNIRSGEMTTLRMFEDTDDEDCNDEDMYPFSDIDDPVLDILARIH